MEEEERARIVTRTTSRYEFKNILQEYPNHSSAADRGWKPSRQGCHGTPAVLLCSLCAAFLVRQVGQYMLQVVRTVVLVVVRVVDEDEPYGETTASIAALISLRSGHNVPLNRSSVTVGP